MIKICLILFKNQRKYMKSLLKILNFDDATGEKIKEHNSNWSKVQSINNWSLINYKPDIDKLYLHAKNPYEAKYQILQNWS